MTVSRRGILGVLAASPVAGPAIAKDVFTATATEPFVPAVGAVKSTLNHASSLINRVPRPKMALASRDTMIKAALKAGIIDMSFLRDRIAADLQRRGMTPLDPDLVQMKSFSLVTKRRIQKQRLIDDGVAEYMGDNKGMHSLISMLADIPSLREGREDPTEVDQCETEL